MRPPKRLFLGLFLFVSILILSLLLYFGYSIHSPNLAIIRYSFIAIVVLLSSVSFFSLLAFGYMFLSILKGISLPFLNRLAEKSVTFLYPYILQLGRMLHITQDKIQRSFIEVNNKLVESRKMQVAPNELLVLLPHCLQNNNCLYRVTGDPYNCHHCGRCVLDPVLNLLVKRQVNVRIVTGGTIARKAVKMFKPKLILAVACERDLSSGIIDSFPIPVWGLLNHRPHGPCYNTSVSIDALNEILNKILKPEKPLAQSLLCDCASFWCGR